MKFILILIVMIFSFPSWSSMTVGTESCPVQFEGKVKEIIEPVGALDAFAVNKVIFENHQTLKGEPDDHVFVDILQNGPFKVERDKDYRVQMRGDRLCWIEEI